MRHVLITGGSDGLGKATAKKLVDSGFKVTILSHDEQKTKAAADEIGCKFVVADVANAAEVTKAIENATSESGPIHTLINNAGVWIRGKLEENSDDEIKQALEINTLGTIYCTKAVVPSMKENKAGRIINVISQAGLYAKAERAVYNASKWALTGFTKSMQDELKPFNISVVGFYPGAMHTRLFSKVGDMKDRAGAMEPQVAADALLYVCNLADGINIPELGIEDLRY